MSVLVQVRGMRVRRGGAMVLHVDSLDVQAGEVLALVGPNGAGKTTLLLALAQLLGRQEGEITFAGTPLSQWGKLDYRRQISLVFQNAMLLDMSVEDNVALGLKFRGLPADRIRELVSQWLRRLGIENLAQRRAVELSGGEAQRVEPGARLRFGARTAVPRRALPWSGSDGEGKPTLGDGRTAGGKSLARPSWLRTT